MLYALSVWMQGLVPFARRSRRGGGDSQIGRKTPPDGQDRAGGTSAATGSGPRESAP